MKSPQNIKNRLIEFWDRDSIRIYEEDGFYSRLEPTTFVNFLSSRTYGDLLDETWRAKKDLLEQHQKFKILKPCLDNLNEFEINFDGYEYPGQKLHFTHQLNVYIIGLFLYANYPALRNAINEEMDETTPEVEVESCSGVQKFRFSGESPMGEFLYRWRLATLSHDLGYVISLLKAGDSKIVENLKNLGKVNGRHYSKVHDVFSYRNRDLFRTLAEHVEKKAGIDIRGISEWIFDKPVFGNSCDYDHGIISAVMFLNLMHREYYQQLGMQQMSWVGADRIVWHKAILDTSILDIAMAVAIHNLDVYEDEADYQKVIDFGEYKKLGKSSFCWLLKMSDMLQVWDKPLASEYDSIHLSDELQKTEIDFEIKPEESKLIVHGCTNKKDRENIPTYLGPITIEFSD